MQSKTKLLYIKVEKINMKKLLFALVALLTLSACVYTGPTKTREETINCTTGSSGDLMDKMGLFLVFGFNTDSTREVCLSFKMKQFEEGNYSTADNTLDAMSSFVVYSSKKDLETTKFFNVVSGNYNVSINQVGDTIISGTMLAIDRKDSTDVPEFTITIPLNNSHSSPLIP